MIPVVDSNWHPSWMHSESDVIHVIKCVYVQQPVEASAAVADIAEMQKLAQTPGLGGLPQGIVAWCDLGQHSIDDFGKDSRISGAHISLVTALAGSTVKSSIAEELTTETADQLQSCFEKLQRQNLSLDIEIDSSQVASISTLLTECSNVPVVLDLSEFAQNGLQIPINQKLRALKPLLALENFHVKVTGIDNDGLTESSDRSRAVMKELINQVGAERLLLASQTVKESKRSTHENMWSLYSDATKYLRAQDREKIFRGNAIRVYDL